MKRGLFLSLDGPDGGGKSTQCSLLAQWLRQSGRTVVTCSDPGGTALGTMLRDVLLGQRQRLGAWAEALLFMASRAQLVEEVIRPALAAGETVVCDRFLLSTVVYQGHAGGLDPSQLWQVGRVAAGAQPELTLVLDLPVEASQARLRTPSRQGSAPDRFESRPADYQARVRAGFRTEAARDPARIRLLDASGSVEDVQDAIRRAVAPLLEEPR